VVAFDGDEVDRAVKAHPEGLVVEGRFTAENQPSTTVYSSTAVFRRSPRAKLGVPDSEFGAPGSDVGTPKQF
jgi:hypothetical protein